MFSQEKKRANTNGKLYGSSSSAFSFDAKGTKEESWTLPCFAGKCCKKKMP
jgi:hypothetical protein